MNYHLEYARIEGPWDTNPQVWWSPREVGAMCFLKKVVIKYELKRVHHLKTYFLAQLPCIELHIETCAIYFLHLSSNFCIQGSPIAVTLPETNSSPPKIDGWKMTCPGLGRLGIFLGALLASGRVVLQILEGLRF